VLYERKIINTIHCKYFVAAKERQWYNERLQSQGQNSTTYVYSQPRTRISDEASTAFHPFRINCAGVKRLYPTSEWETRRRWIEGTHTAAIEIGDSDCTIKGVGWASVFYSGLVRSLGTREPGWHMTWRSRDNWGSDPDWDAYIGTAYVWADMRAFPLKIGRKFGPKLIDILGIAPKGTGLVSFFLLPHHSGCSTYLLPLPNYCIPFYQVTPWSFTIHAQLAQTCLWPTYSHCTPAWSPLHRVKNFRFPTLLCGVAQSLVMMSLKIEHLNNSLPSPPYIPFIPSSPFTSKS